MKYTCTKDTPICEFYNNGECINVEDCRHARQNIPPINSTVYIPDTDSGKLTDIDIYKVTAHKITAYGTFIEVTGEYGTRKVRPETVCMTIKDAIKAAERKLNG